MSKPSSGKSLPFANWKLFRSLYSNLGTIREGIQFNQQFSVFLMELMQKKMYSTSCSGTTEIVSASDCVKDPASCIYYCQMVDNIYQDRCFHNPITCFDASGYYGAFKDFIDNELYTSGKTWLNDINKVIPVKEISSYIGDNPTHPIKVVPNPPWENSFMSNVKTSASNITSYYSASVNLLMTYVSGIAKKGGTANKLADSSNAPFFSKLQKLYCYQNKLEQLLTQMKTFALITAGNKKIADTDPSFPYSESDPVPVNFIDSNYMSDMLQTIIDFNRNHCNPDETIQTIQLLKDGLSIFNSQDFTEAVNNLPIKLPFLENISMPLNIDGKPDVRQLQEYGKTEEFKKILADLSNYVEALSSLMFTYFLEVINSKNTTGTGIPLTDIFLKNFKSLLIEKNTLNSVINNLSLFSNTKCVPEGADKNFYCYNECLCNNSECLVVKTISNPILCTTMTCGWPAIILSSWFENIISDALHSNNYVDSFKPIVKLLLPGTSLTLATSLGKIINYKFPAWFTGEDGASCTDEMSGPGNAQISDVFYQRKNMLNALVKYDQLVATAIFQYMVSFVFT